MPFQDIIRDHAAELGLIDEALARFRAGNSEPVRDPVSDEPYTVWADDRIGVLRVSRGGKVVQRIRFTPGTLSRTVAQGS